MREGIELRRERQLAVDGAVVQRLDPEAVAREHEPPGARVPDRDREHAAQPLPQARSPFLVAVREHLGVAMRAEPVTGAFELVLELAVVVDLAVLDDDDVPSSFAIGWSPPVRSMIASRRAAIPTRSSVACPRSRGRDG